MVDQILVIWFLCRLLAFYCLLLVIVASMCECGVVDTCMLVLRSVYTEETIHLIRVSFIHVAGLCASRGVLKGVLNKKKIYTLFRWSSLKMILKRTSRHDITIFKHHSGCLRQWTIHCLYWRRWMIHHLYRIFYFSKGGKLFTAFTLIQRIVHHLYVIPPAWHPRVYSEPIFAYLYVVPPAWRPCVNSESIFANINLRDLILQYKFLRGLVD